MTATARAELLRTLAALGVAVAATASLPARALASNGAYAIATSPRAAGRGGADQAVGDDSFGLLSNPAAMARTFGWRADAGLMLHWSQATFTNERNQGEIEGFPAYVPAIGFVADVGARADGGAGLGAPIQLGLALSVMAGGSWEADFRTALFPEGESERSAFSVLGLTAGASWRASPRLSFGVSITGMRAALDQSGLAGTGGESTAGLVRNFDGEQVDAADELFLVNGTPVRWSEVFEAARAPNAFSSSRIDIDDATGLGAGATLGVLYDATEWLSIGLSYRTPGFFGDLSGDAFLDATRAAAAGSGSLDAIQAGFLGEHLPDDGAFLASPYRFALKGFRLPQIAAAGVALRPHDAVLVAIDVKWIGWSSAFDEVTIELDRGASRDLSEITSNQRSARVRTRQRYDWRDQVVVACGAAVAVTDWLTLRAGYNYGSNPAPRSTLSPFASATAEHHATIGAGIRLGPVAIDVAYAHAFAHATTISGSAVNREWDGIRHKADQDTVWIGIAIER